VYLLLVRHAIACERDAQRWPDDGTRPLTSRGRRRARETAAGLRRLTASPERVLSSPLRRAQQTADILHRYAEWPRAEECALLLPQAAPAALLALLGAGTAERVAVVGHQPALGRLLSACLTGQPRGAAFELKKMGMALIAFEGAAQAGRGRLLWLLTPRTLRAAR
jgi:phosphohistidine phosphatase